MTPEVLQVIEFLLRRHEEKDKLVQTLGDELSRSKVQQPPATVTQESTT